MKIIVDKMPEEGYKCIFHRKEYTYAPVINCGIDGHLCDMECDGHCEKLITLEMLESMKTCREKGD